MDFEELRAACMQCSRCRLASTRTNVVFGVGDEHADILFVGEGPGRNEDLQGEPFVGRAGQLLDNYLAAVGLRRQDVYIANIVKCRPPENRDPQPDEQDACIGWLRAQFKLISPKLVVCLGRIAAKKMIGDDFLVTRDHGRVYDKGGVLMMGTFHPAALLRNPNNKPAALDDFHKIAGYAGDFSAARPPV
ncbi:MAG: uracil-DNA glycosylase [Oscillospiraceae bacterium]|nr:uracil-DNA glycosylase [Oscillospiraceae bacterium]